VVALGAQPAGGSRAATGTICGQLKGPYASFWSSVTGLKLKGTTWTVIATGVPCPFALASTPGLLTQWTKAPIGGSLTLKGGHCVKMSDRAYSGSGTSSGGFVCTTGSVYPVIFGPKTFTARMTDGWSTSQMKQYLGLT
jgi:hypothetical protein